MKNYFRCRFSGTQALLALVLFTAGGCLVVKAALFRPEATNTGPQKTLTFADRVAYQYAIEEVYWRHRIWPKENPGTKPSLDAVISRAQIENKVQDYLRKSQLIEDRRGWPITGNELQAGLERMAAHTKQPDVLRELFAALGNDPFVIAECLAKPILTDRLVADLSGKDKTWYAKSARTNTRHSASTATTLTTAAYVLPRISEGNPPCTDDTWTPTSTTSAPIGRYDYTAIWTGSEMIVWGGVAYPDPTNTGGRYNPSTDSWVATTTVNAPFGRSAHRAVWTGSEMIVWGGMYGHPFNTGGRYNPISDTWIATSTTNAPSERSDHTAVWTGSEMIVWGGTANLSLFYNTGGKYNPSTDSWTATSLANAPSARAFHTAVWTGSKMIIWGGGTGGGRYDPNTDSWVPVSTINASAGGTAVWTGSEMIVWGSTLNSNGGRYNPNTDAWVATTTTNAPSGRVHHTAVWTGSQMIVWGGQDSSNNPINTGGRYNPDTDSWTATTTTNAPSSRFEHTAVWTGSEMVILGGWDFVQYLNTGGVYCAQPSTPIVQSATSRKPHAGAGTFDVNLPLSGTPGIECRSGGATNDYTIGVTFLANVSVNGNPQAAVTAGSGTVGSGGMSNGGVVTIAGNIVTVPLTDVGNAQTITVTLFAVNGSTNVVIPMSVLIGDTTGNAAVNAGDVSQTKLRVGQGVDQTNFRSDVNTNGSINATDASIVKSYVGTGLP